MKILFKYIPVIMICFLLHACRAVELNEMANDNYVKIITDIASNPVTKVSDNGEDFTLGDCIRVYNSVSSDNNIATYVFSGNSKWITSDDFQWVGKNENIFYGSYPATSSHTEFKIPLDQSQGYKNADWMITDASSAKIADGYVSLSFRHMLSKVTVDFKEIKNQYRESYVESAQMLTLISTISNTYAPAPDDAGAQFVTAKLASDAMSFTLILAPGTYKAGDEVMKILMAGDTQYLIVKAKADVTIKPSEAYDFHLSIGKDCIEIAPDGISVTAWDNEILDEIIFDINKDDAIRLDKDGTANCYVIREGGVYKFPAVKGNSNEPVGEVDCVNVLWETYCSNKSISVGSLIPEVKYENGNVIFRTNDNYKKGNALIVARDADSNILWSWHIWMIEDRIVQQYYYLSGQVMMDRNLGALVSEPGTSQAIGLYYQWGRKDPFLGSYNIVATGSYDYSPLVFSTHSWPDVVVSDQTIGTIEYTIANPTTFIYEGTNGGKKNYDWLYTGTYTSDNTRWGREKTIYDPCPVGWKVPEGGINGIWYKSGFPDGSDSSNSSGYDIIYDDLTKSKTFMHSLPAARYPISGCYHPSNAWNDDYIRVLGNYGYYWTVSPYSTYAYFLELSEVNTHTTTNYYRTFGCSIRCEKELASNGSENVTLPVIMTGDIKDITENSAVVDAIVQDNGGSPIISKGIIWGADQNLTVDLSTKTSDGYGDDDFVVKISDLRLNTKYYVRSYATNSAGTAYGEIKSFELAPIDFSSSVSLGNSANCYIVSKAGTYQFNCSKNNNAAISGAFDIKVLWESTYESSLAIGDLIKYATYDNGYVKFITNSRYREGNALLAAVDKNGVVLWSWHIWMVEDTIAEHKHKNNKGVMMDRNLGALSTTPGDVKSFGLLYEWGRKDPFVGSSSTTSNTRLKTTNNHKWNVSDSGPETGTIEYSIKNPMTFITSGQKNYDWYYTGDGTTAMHDRWSKSKSIYDPCPAGWRVPTAGKSSDSNGIWAGFPAGDDVIEYNSNRGVKFPASLTGSEAWYPFAGYLSNSDGQLQRVGTDTRVWSHSIYTSQYSYNREVMTILSIYKSDKYEKASSSQGGIAQPYGCSVRCQKQ